MRGEKEIRAFEVSDNDDGRRKIGGRKTFGKPNISAELLRTSQSYTTQLDREETGNWRSLPHYPLESPYFFKVKREHFSGIFPHPGKCTKEMRVENFLLLRRQGSGLLKAALFFMQLFPKI